MLPIVEMSEPFRRRVLLELPWPTLLKILLAAAAVWCLIQLIDIILLLMVAVILTVTLDPIACWLERRGMSRTASVTVISVAILTLVGGFVWLTWPHWSNRLAISRRTRMNSRNNHALPSEMAPEFGGLEQR
jgi:predicted PurR-regulated permease PerM